ncbi:MAG: hypothetical protein QXM86_02255 [Candidatus Bathyarchaeia archaeon]
MEVEEAELKALEEKQGKAVGEPSVFDSVAREGFDDLNEEKLERMQELLKVISEETSQLNDFLSKENQLINELCVSLKRLLNKLHISFNIPPSHLPFKTKIRKAILDEDATLITTDEKGKEHSMFLADYHPDIIVAVLWDIMPEVAKSVTAYRKKISARVNFFMKLKKELEGILKAVVGTKGSLSR